MSVLSRVRRTIREHDLARARSRVIVALSGGPDSVALAHVAAALASEGDLVFAGIAHFNHQLRDTAARDERFSADVARALGVPFDAGRADIRALARAANCSIEDAAHRARHRFLDEARERLGADVVALGHTRDDQAETFLLRLLRGAGPRGLAAMHPRHGCFVRPLLECRRAELVEWLDDRGLRYVADETNADVAVPRNRVRAELLPLLAARFNPGIVDVLADAAELARGEWALLSEVADAAFLDIAAIGHGTVELAVERLAAMPLALRRLIVWKAMSRLTSRPVTFAHVRDVLALLAAGADGRAIDGPGQVANRTGRSLVLKTRAPHAPPQEGAGRNFFEYLLSIPGEVLVPEAGGVLTAEEGVPGPAATARLPGGGRAEMAVVRRDLCGTRLTVRNRRPGDRIRPVGLGGSRKLQDVFVDRKIARAERDRIPVVVHENGGILWVAGFGISEEFRVTDPAQPMLILRFRVVGGPD